MDRDEARAQLVELGARTAAARLQMYEAAENYLAAQHELIGLSAGGLASELTAEDQYACWLESVALIGADPGHPAFNEERAAFERARWNSLEKQLQDQINNAEWN